MESSNLYSFTRYLSAKKTVDDRSLNKTVLQSLMAELSVLPDHEPLQVLEIGAGIGTMVERALDWGIVQQAEYTALDAEAENINAAMTRLPTWAKKNGFSVTEPDAWQDSAQEASRGGSGLSGASRRVRFHRAGD